jgi:hypothetical protein
MSPQIPFQKPGAPGPDRRPGPGPHPCLGCLYVEKGRCVWFEDPLTHGPWLLDPFIMLCDGHHKMIGTVKPKPHRWSEYE